MQPYFLIVCVKSEKETEDMALPQPSHAQLHSGNDTKLKDVTSCIAVFILRNKVHWVAVPCDWVIASPHFEGMYRFHLKGRVRELTHKPTVEGGTFFWKVGKQLPNHTRQKLEQQFLNSHAVESSKYFFHIVKNISISDYWIFFSY
jgi:hypothetical protein